MNKAKVVFSGIPRSGSTLLWQVFTHIVPHTIGSERTTPRAWKPDGISWALCAYRNPYDVAASKYTLRKGRAKVEEKPEIGVRAVSGHVVKLFDALKNLKATYDKCLVFKYEDFIYDFTPFYEAIEKLFEMEVPQSQRKEIYDLCCLEANKKKCASPDIDDMYKEFWLHRKHINSPEPGSWINVIPESCHTLLRNKCGRICKEWGYDE